MDLGKGERSDVLRPVGDGVRNWARGRGLVDGGVDGLHAPAGTAREVAVGGGGHWRR
jgi:hypothetical protein